MPLGEHIGYLPQDVELFAGTVGENIARFARRYPATVLRAIVALRNGRMLHEMILQLPDGYDTHIGEAGAACSRAVNASASPWRGHSMEIRGLVVLDEPNANLDVVGEAALVETMANLKARGVTVIMVSTTRTFMATLDKLALLGNGMLEMFGPSAAVMARLRHAAADSRRHRSRPTDSRTRIS